jgi:hypothetical protein
MSETPIRRLSRRLSGLRALRSDSDDGEFDLDENEVVFSESTLKRAWIALGSLFCLEVLAIRLAGPSIQRYSDLLTGMYVYF